MTGLVIDRIEEDEERIIFHVSTFMLPFTRSNGTMLARVYERLTKRSRRKSIRQAKVGSPCSIAERHYRRGIYDAYKALQQELE